MNITYIGMALVALAIFALLVIYIRKDQKQKRISTATSMAFALILAGILFGDSLWLSYTLIGIGVLLAVIDIIIQSRPHHPA